MSKPSRILLAALGGALGAMACKSAPSAEPIAPHAPASARGMSPADKSVPPSEPPITPVPVAPPTEPPAQTPAEPKQGATVEGITEYRLDNGLRVLLYPDDSQAKVMVAVTYDVGSRYEGYGESGMAHLLEHMQFKGTPRFPTLWADLQQHGAINNATTDYDRTNYFETLPATDENLAFAIDLEADRMVNSNIAADDLAKEFSVVRNEFERGENSPERILEERMLSTAYLWHNYGKSVIGSQADIERVPADSLRRFYKKFYQPDNATLVIAGKFDAKKALALVEQHFGAIPRPERKLEATYSVEPVQDGEREVVLRRTGDVQEIGILYHTVAGPDPRFVATEALAFIMTDPPSGRLYNALVKSGMATSVHASNGPMAEPGTLAFFVQVRADKPMEPVRKKLIEIVEGVAKNPPSAEEIARFKARQAKNFALAMTDSERVGRGLSNWAAQGDWRLYFLHRDRVEKVTSADVVAVAGEFCKPVNRTVGLFYPTKTLDRSPLPGEPDVAAMLKDYEGRAAVAAGEAFEATIENVEQRTTRVTLPGGLKLAMLPKQTHGNVVQARMSIHLATEKDLVGHEEAASFVPAMLMRGSTKHAFQQLREEVDRLKGQANLTGGDGDAVLSLTTTRENLAALVALAGEVLRTPAFPRDQFEIVKKDRLTALEEQLSDPAAQARLQLERSLNPWPKKDFRYVPTTEEQIARVKAVTLEEVKRMYKSFWGASFAEITIIGDFDPAEAQAAVTKAFGDWKNPHPFVRIATPYKAVAADQLTIDTPDKKMAEVVVGIPVEIRDDDADYPALFMVNFILGGSESSRLFMRLRQKEGWSYGTNSGLTVSDLDRRGQLTAHAICAPQNAEKALAAILEEIDHLVKGGVTADELDKAKEMYRGRFTNRMTNDGFLINAINHDLFVGRTLAFQKKLNDDIARLTPADIRRVLDKHYLQASSLVKVMAGDLKKPSATAQ